MVAKNCVDVANGANLRHIMGWDNMTKAMEAADLCGAAAAIRMAAGRTVSFGDQSARGPIAAIMRFR